MKGTCGSKWGFGKVCINNNKRIIGFIFAATDLKKYYINILLRRGIFLSFFALLRVLRNPKLILGMIPYLLYSKRVPFGYIKAEWLHPGLHITCMGADLPEKQELEPEVLGKVDILACDRKSQCIAMGELHHGFRAGILSNNSDISELGEITSGRKHGRRSEDQITLCDLTGTGVQDTAIALLALQKTGEQGLGVEIDNRIG